MNYVNKDSAIRLKEILLACENNKFSLGDIVWGPDIEFGPIPIFENVELIPNDKIVRIFIESYYTGD